MNVRIRVQNQPPLSGRLVYLNEEDSFDFYPDEAQAVDSELLVQFLAISTDSTDGSISSIWGYSPRQSWEPAMLQRPATIQHARLALADPSLLYVGAGRELHSDGDWRCLFDPDSQILELRLRHSSVSNWFGIAVGTRIGLDAEDCIAALQLEPEFV